MIANILCSSLFANGRGYAAKVGEKDLFATKLRTDGTEKYKWLLIISLSS